ncbi:lactamase_B domain-containing protein [Haematococcus lacustris]|uniref:ribonuclease Z n=1 Tax=Haematococcus lacustris TaxID=44745 RepID=A0A699YKD4_HAELA|nr:lactamase_B domain-containing protein [Haematococcus lacustris]
MDALFAAPGQRGRALESEAPCPPTSTSASPRCQPAPGIAPTLPHASTLQQAPVAALLFLGTGSAEPSKYRSASGILLRCPGGQGSLLMDCGEGSWGQLLRWLGQDAADALATAKRHSTTSEAMLVARQMKVSDTW